MTQTAVEWLEDRYRPKGYITAEEFEQAKEIEKYQIIDAFEEGISDEASQQNTTPQQYYHKKYGGKDAE